MQVPEQVKTVMDRLTAAGHDCALVGGCVRDWLLGIEPHDYDLATAARPEQVMALFDHTVPTGLRHGTVTVLLDKTQVEVTTYRREGTYSDNRHPDQVEFVEDVEQDLARRDFTINAMAWNPVRGLVDPFGGRQDLEKGLIRAVGDPVQRFEEDALRMVRAWRFAARLGFTLDPATRRGIDRCQSRIADVAVERLVPEWLEILRYDPGRVMDMTGLFAPWIPELEFARQTPQHSPYHYTGVLQHILDSIRYLDPFDDILALTLLLHDLGKPETRTTSAGGRDHFKGHPIAGQTIALRVVEELKLPSAWKKVIPQLVLHHDDILPRSLEAIFRLRITEGWSDEWVRMLFRVQYCDIMAHSAKGRQRLERLKASQAFYEEQTASRPLSLKELAIDGRDIMTYTGLRNRQISQALQAVLEYAWYHPEKNNRLDLLTFVLRSLPRLEGGMA